MQDASDFSLRIVVMAPERVVLADDHATTSPFTRAALPGVDLRSAQERTHIMRAPVAPSPSPSASPSLSLSPSLSHDPEPLPPPRHAWLPSHSGRQPVPSRLKARSLLGVPPPPPTRASPLSDDDERRMLRRERARRRIAWAQRLLQRFHFVAPG